jgi:hypothetical protein
MTSDGLTRAQFADRQFLRTSTMVDEQDYHIGARRRQNLLRGSWGIIEGLRLEGGAEGLAVTPGVAIDGYGREIVLGERTGIPRSRFEEKGTRLLDIWIEYRRVALEATPAGYAGCKPCASSAGAVAYSRWREAPQLRFELPPDTDTPNRREPPGVPDADFAFASYRTAPHEDQAVWPVFLGQVRLDTENREHPYIVNEEGRPYAGLIGEAVAAPSGKASLRLGTAGSDTTARFAVSVLGQDPDNPHCTTLNPQFEIDPCGKATIHGRTVVLGDVVMDGGKVEFKAGTVERSNPASVSHHQDAGGTHELRIELPSGDAGQVSIGHWDEDAKRYQPCLIVKRDGVTVTGNIILKQGFDDQQEDGTPSPVNLMQRFGPEGLQEFAALRRAGIVASSVLLPTLRATLPPAVSPPQSFTPAELARDLLADETFRAEFIARVREVEELRFPLAKALRPRPPQP